MHFVQESELDILLTQIRIVGHENTMSYIPSFSKRNRKEKEMVTSPLEISYYTTGWIRTISLYAESQKKIREKETAKVLTTNLIIGNVHKQT